MTPPEIWVPQSARAAFRCEVCGTEFYAEEDVKYARHVAKCARKHHDELMAVSAMRTRNPLEQAVDQEAVDFQLRKYGRG